MNTLNCIIVIFFVLAWIFSIIKNITKKNIFDLFMNVCICISLIASGINEDTHIFFRIVSCIIVLYIIISNIIKHYKKT